MRGEVLADLVLEADLLVQAHAATTFVQLQAQVERAAELLQERRTATRWSPQLSPARSTYAGWSELMRQFPM